MLFRSPKVTHDIGSREGVPGIKVKFETCSSCGLVFVLLLKTRNPKESYNIVALELELAHHVRIWFYSDHCPGSEPSYTDVCGGSMDYEQSVQTHPYMVLA